MNTHSILHKNRLPVIWIVALVWLVLAIAKGLDTTPHTFLEAVTVVAPPSVAIVSEVTSEVTSEAMPAIVSQAVSDAGSPTQEASHASHSATIQGDKVASVIPVVAQTAPLNAAAPLIQYTLRTNIGHEGMTYVGVGGAIDGLINPNLTAQPGDIVEITLVNGDGAEHDLMLPDLNVMTEHVTGLEAQTVVTFPVDQAGVYAYFCSLPGHRQAGMEGKFIVGATAAMAETIAPSIVRDPTDLQPSLGVREPTTVYIAMTAVELEGQLANDATLTYWTFDNQVPGPFVRVRVGDTVEIKLRNAADSRMVHSIDLHAVTGPGGGATVTQVAPGEEKSFTFQALNPGLYVYHCATPMVAHHIASGMYGLILVEPEGGLPPVDHEFYVMQGELYTQAPYGATGLQTFSEEKLLAEAPEYYVFNGAVGALTEQYPLQAKVGETVRIFFGVGGPNAISSFHVIGEIFDRVYDQASLTSVPLTDVQTTLVPPGGATVVEFELEVPGHYMLVDHALTRAARGLAGVLVVEGEENLAVFHEGPIQ